MPTSTRPAPRVRKPAGAGAAGRGVTRRGVTGQGLLGGACWAGSCWAGSWRMGSSVAGRYRLGERRPPGGGREGVGEVLGLVRDLAAGELHDADRVGGRAAVGDDALADPQVAAAQDPQDGEVAFGRVAAALRLDLRRPGSAPRTAGSPGSRRPRRSRARCRCPRSRRLSSAPRCGPGSRSLGPLRCSPAPALLGHGSASWSRFPRS